jgi:hypothetical protein
MAFTSLSTYDNPEIAKMPTQVMRRFDDTMVRFAGIQTTYGGEYRDIQRHPQFFTNRKTSFMLVDGHRFNSAMNDRCLAFGNSRFSTSLPHCLRDADESVQQVVIQQRRMHRKCSVFHTNSFDTGFAEQR